MKRYESLDGMRGVCAVTVALLHFDSVLLTGFLANYGWLSVDVFFIISGFVIAMKYEDRLRGGFSFGAFIKARAARLLPTQVLGTIVVALSMAELFISDRLNVSEIQILAYVFLCAILLVPTAISLAIPSTYIWKGAFPINPPLWSMQGEWVVNCIYAAGLFAVRSRILFALYTTIAAYLVTHMAHESPPQWDHVVPYEAVPTISRALMGFICGVLFSRLEKRGSLTRLPMIRPEFIFGIWFLICLVPRTHPMPLFEAFFATLYGPLMIAILIRSDRQLPKLYATLGRLSYPLYASHFAIVNLSLNWLTPASHPSIFWAIPMLTTSLILAWLLDRVSDRSSRLRTYSQRPAAMVQTNRTPAEKASIETSPGNS